MKRAYVIGNNTSKSLSPKIFNYWFKKYNIKGYYNFIEIQEDNFNKKIKSILKKKETLGFNITIPFKEKIIPYLSNIDYNSKNIGAINCVTVNGIKLLGTNTDWLGFKNSLLSLNKKHTKNNVAIVIGYGGSAKAIIYSLEKMKFKKIKIFNRTFKKIIETKNIKAYELKDLGKHIESANLVINTIPKKGFYKKIFKTKKPTINIKKNVIGYDLAYTEETNFLDLFSVKSRITGLYLLVYQAAPCFEKWFGKKPKIDNHIFETLNKNIYSK